MSSDDSDLPCHHVVLPAKQREGGGTGTRHYQPRKIVLERVNGRTEPVCLKAHRLDVLPPWSCHCCVSESTMSRDWTSLSSGKDTYTQAPGVTTYNLAALGYMLPLMAKLPPVRPWEQR